MSGLFLVWLGLVACGHDGPQRDRDGCWTNPREAWMAIGERYCRDGWYTQDSEACVHWMENFAQVARKETCFNGCAVDDCLEWLDAEYAWFVNRDDHPEPDNPNGARDYCSDGPGAAFVSVYSVTPGSCTTETAGW